MCLCVSVRACMCVYVSVCACVCVCARVSVPDLGSELRKSERWKNGERKRMKLKMVDCAKINEVTCSSSYPHLHLIAAEV
jgi:hypothetical protein